MPDNTQATEEDLSKPTEVERLRIEVQENAKIIRELLVAMCRQYGKSIVSEFDADKEAANYTLAQRLGIGSVFGIPDHEDPKKVEVHFVGGPWDTQKIAIANVTAPVFAVGHQIGTHYWLDTKSGNFPAYHWDGTEWEVTDK